MSDTSFVNHKQSESSRVRVVLDIRGDFWFALDDVCRMLDLSSESEAVSDLEARDRSEFPLGAAHLSVISEPGLYELIWSSDNPNARTLHKFLAKILYRPRKFTFAEMLNQVSCSEIKLES